MNLQLLNIFDRSESAARFQFLSRLELSYTNVDLEIFCSDNISLASFTHLYLDGCFNVTNYTLFYLLKLSLAHLDISHCTAVDDTGLEVIAHVLPNIQSLNLSYIFRLTDRGLPKLFRLPTLKSVNFLGCYRIRSYPWALAAPGRKVVTNPVTELLLGEDSRIQTGGFWLLWCCWSWDMSVLAESCPFLETVRVNMVLFDLLSDGLLAGCKSLKHLSLVVERSGAQSLCDNAEKLGMLDSLELTCHIGLTTENVTSLIDSGALNRLTAIKFHSKHTRVFTDANFVKFADLGAPLEYLNVTRNQSVLLPSARYQVYAYRGGKYQSDVIQCHRRPLRQPRSVNQPTRLK